MKKGIFYIVLSVMLMGLSGCGYNTMQANEEAVKAAGGDVEASYQRRNDLIPNLVEVVKGYAKHEQETLTAVTEARARVGSIQASKNLIRCYPGRDGVGYPATASAATTIPSPRLDTFSITHPQGMSWLARFLW